MLTLHVQENRMHGGACVSRADPQNVGEELWFLV